MADEVKTEEGTPSIDQAEAEQAEQREAQEQARVFDKASELPVLVTGASGFVAGHVISQLLAKGYKVRGTVRSVEDAQTKYATVYALLTDEGRALGAELELVAANLLTEGSFDEAAQGCEYVMHIASPYMMKINDPQKDLVDPAVNGTLNVLRACQKAPTVKKVVLTSSFAAVCEEPVQGHTYTEADWNTTSGLTKAPYFFSKAEAEKAAWKFIEESKPHFGLTAMNPFMVFGPEITSTRTKATDLNESNQLIYNILAGAYPAVFNFMWGFVDVRDVAAAHVLGMENPEVTGRNILSGECISLAEVVELLKKNFPQATKLPSVNLTGGFGSSVIKLYSLSQVKAVGRFMRSNVGKKYELDNSKCKKYGLVYRDQRIALVEFVKWLEDKGFTEKCFKK